ARFTAPPQEADLHSALERARQRVLDRGWQTAEAEAVTARPFAADVLAAHPAVAGAPLPPALRGVSEPEARQTAIATEQAAQDVAAGKARVLLPGGVPASYTERAVGRALAPL